MADSIERIAGEIDARSGNANGITPAELMGWATRLRALSPAGGGGRGCDWYEDEDTGSRIVDFDFASDHSRQLSLILKANGEVAYAAYINGTHMNGADAMTPEFYSAIRMLSASPQKSPTVGDWMMVPARLTGPMAYAMVERLGHPDSSPQDCWTATLAASPQQEPGTASDYAAWMQDPDSGVEPPEQWKEAYRLGREVGHEECAPAQHNPSGQTLAGAGGELRQALQNAIALWGHRCADCTQLVWLESAEKALATSAGTTGDDSARLDWLLSRIPDTVLLFHGAAVDEGWPDKSPSRKGIDAARRAREVG